MNQAYSSRKQGGGISATILRERFMEQEFRNNSTKELVGKNIIENQDTTQKTSQKIVKLIQNNNEISTQEMANIIGIDRRNIARQIKNLQAKGIIRRVVLTRVDIGRLLISNIYPILKGLKNTAMLIANLNKIKS